MTAARVRRRTLAKTCPVCKSRVHWLVVFRLGGRGFPELTAGTFHVLSEAQTRRDVVAGEIAAMRDPRLLLEQLRQPVEQARTYRQWAEAYRDSRIDHSAESRRNVNTAIGQLEPIFRDADPRRMTVAQQIEAVAVLAATRKPSTVKEYWTTHRKILDFAGADPNPARDPSVRLPRRVREEPQPPSAAHVLAILDNVPRSRRLPLVVLEQTGMAAGELHQLAWGDVDLASSRFRLRQATVKAQIRSRARWVQLPDWLMAAVAASCPPDDRTPGRLVFPGATPPTMQTAMRRACATAGIPLYSPHDLRHRRLSLWHGQGVPARELAARAGHSQTSMTLDVYSHVLLTGDEIQPERLAEVLR